LLAHIHHHLCPFRAGRVSSELVTNAYNLNNLIFLAARLPQIYQNYKVELGGTCWSTSLVGKILPMHTPDLSIRAQAQPSEPIQHSFYTVRGDNKTGFGVPECLQIFHMGTWVFSLGEAKQRNCTLAEKQQTHWGRPFQSA